MVPCGTLLFTDALSESSNSKDTVFYGWKHIASVSGVNTCKLINSSGPVYTGSELIVRTLSLDLGTPPPPPPAESFWIRVCTLSRCMVSLPVSIVADRKHASTYSPVAFRSVHTGIEPPFLLKISLLA